LTTELVRLRVDLIVATNSLAGRAARRATNVIPIVVPVMGDPVSDGLVTNLARPDGNVTGLTFLGPELLARRVALLKEALPTISEVTALWHPNAYSERTMSDMIKQSDDAARTLRLQLRPVAVMAPTIWRRPSQGIAATAMSAAIVAILRSIRFTFRVPHKVARMREATSGHTWLNQLIGPHVATLMRATDASLSTSPGIC
jgi:putative ABC transport system substrate-binding protein